jgi:hypothetical protein
MKGNMEQHQKSLQYLAVPMHFVTLLYLLLRDVQSWRVQTPGH